MSKKTFIEKIRVETPCAENWDEMRGSDEARLCSHCSKSVNNLSAMTRKRALKIVKESNGNLCVRYIKNPLNNAPVFSEKLYQISRRAPRLAASVTAAALSLSSMAYAQGGAKLPEIAGTAEAVKRDKQSDKDKTQVATSSVSGTITDVSGAVIPGAVVSLLNETTGERQATTNDEGFYEIENLTAGIYVLKVESLGFRLHQIENISVAESENSKRDVAMEVNSEMVTVGEMISVSFDYENPLFNAVSEANLEEAVNLIAKGANVNAKDENHGNITPLFLAVENGSAEIAETLLNFGAKANVRDKNKQTPLMRLDDDATPKLIRILIKHGAKINFTDTEGNTALMFAAADAKTEVLQVLLDHRAEVNARNKTGRTALMNAADEDNLENVRALILAGADVNLKNEDGETAWDLTGDDEIAKLLERYGATVEDAEFEPPVNP